METLHINDIREMSRVRVINALARYVPDNTYKRIDFLKMETEVLKDLLTCYLNPKAKLPTHSKNVIMKLDEPTAEDIKIAIKIMKEARKVSTKNKK